MAFLFPDQLLSALCREVDLVSDDANSLDDATRATKLATIAADMLAVEREEEALIVQAEQAGNQILRRPDADPRAVLQIELITAASRSASMPPIVSSLISKITGSS